MRSAFFTGPALAAAALIVRAAVTGPSRAAAPDPTPIAWGEVKNGLQAGVRIPAGRIALRQGEPLRAEVVIRNTTGKSIQVDHWGPALWTAERSGDRITLRLGTSEAGFAAMNATILGAGEQMDAPTVPPVAIIREPDWKGDPTDFSVPTLRLPAGTYQLSVQSALRADTSDAGEKRGRLPTGMVEFRVLRDAVVTNSISLTPYRIAWGEVKDGLQLGSSFAEGRTSYQVEEVIPFNLHVRNTTEQPKTLRHWTYPASDYSPEVTDTTGNRVNVDVVRFTIPPGAFDRTVKPHEAMIVAHPKLELAPPSKFTNNSVIPTMTTVPGKYRLRHHTIFGLTQGPDGFTSFQSGELAMEVPPASRQ